MFVECVELQLKRCTKCGVEKLLGEFGKCTAKRDGLNSSCKVCTRAATKNMIAARTQAGVKRAMERGVKFGQPTKITDDVRDKINGWLADGLSIPEIVKRFKAERFKLAESTIRKYWRAEEIAAARATKKRKTR